MRVDGARLSNPHILTITDGLGRRNYLSVSKCDRHFFSLISLIKVADHTLLHVLPCTSRHHLTFVFCFLDLLLIVFIPLSIPSILELLWPLSFSMLAHHWGSIIKMAWDAWPLRHLKIMTQFHRAWESRACPRFPKTLSFLSHAPFCPQSLCCLWGDALHLAECLLQIPGAFRCR